MFKPAKVHTEINRKPELPQAYYLVDKRTNDRRLMMRLPVKYDETLFDVIALMADERFVIEPRVYKYNIKPKQVIEAPKRINRLTDYLKVV